MSDTPTLVPTFPLFAIINVQNGVEVTATVCDILLTEDGEPLVTQNNEYFATEGLMS